jgi:Skp family chaperone for outer membrane proteins
MKPGAIVLATVGGLALLAAAALPADAPRRELKIGVVNIKHCFDPTRYRGAQDAQHEIDAEVERLGKEVEALDKQIKDKEAEVKMARGPGSTPETVQQLLQEANILALKRKMIYEINQQKAVGESQRIQTNLYNAIRKAISEFGQAQGYDLILKVDEMEMEERSVEPVARRANYRPVLYHAPAMDVTDKILAQLEAGYKKGKPR